MRVHVAGRVRCLHALLESRSGFRSSWQQSLRLVEQRVAAPAVFASASRVIPRRHLACRAVAELDAPATPNASGGLQLEVAFEEPTSRVPVTYINTTARVISSASLVRCLRMRSGCQPVMLRRTRVSRELAPRRDGWSDGSASFA
jgi:hypothetical protein